MKPTSTDWRLAIALSLCLIPIQTCFSQKAPMKFGKVDKADLEMKTYPLDTSAVAVILCNYGHFTSTDVMFTRGLRIKILKKEGTSYGNQIFYTFSKANFKGITFNQENGEIVESKLESESIFKERVYEDYYRFRIAMPNVKVGSVIDIQYSNPYIPYEWRFQEEIPVVWNELIMDPYIGYKNLSKTTYGFIPFSEQSDIRWVAKNVPAFKPEPYINSIENYIGKFEFHFSKTWENINNNLCDNPYFGNTLQGFFLNDIVRDIETKYKDAIDKLRAAYEAVKVVKWNEEKSLFTSRTDLNYIYKKKIGNSADINLILVLLLKKLNFEAYPVILSTRDNGELRIYSPSYNKLNYTIACAKLNGKVYLFDATEELIPFDLLPVRSLNEKGRIISEDHSDWVSIIADKKDKKLIQYDIKLNVNDILTGKITKTRVDYSAFNYRKNYKKFNSQDEYLKDLEKENNGLQVENCAIKNLDSIYNPLIEEYDVKIKNKIKRVGNLLYINPMFYEQIVENPFKLDERKFPVDFTYPIETFYILNLTIPEEMIVEQIPKPMVLKLQDNSASISYKISNSSNIIKLSYKYQLNKPIFKPVEYYSLKELFTELVKKHAEPIVLKEVK